MPGMRFNPADIDGAWLVEPERHEDSRGWFVRTFCERSFAVQGLETRFVQHSASRTRAKGAVRGMHYQAAPHGEVKLVSCRRGAIFDVVLDLRPRSASFGQWRGFELSAENGRQLYIPEGCAHGFQTLCEEAEVGYLISAFYTPDAARGVRHDDPQFGISWPLPVSLMSDKDRAWPDFAP